MIDFFLVAYGFLTLVLYFWIRRIDKSHSEDLQRQVEMFSEIRKIIVLQQDAIKRLQEVLNDDDR